MFVLLLFGNMAKLRCNCLNICVETVGTKLREVDGNSFVSDGSCDSFFREKLYEVQLAVGGIRKELEILIRQRSLEDWIVYRCLGCNTEPFALHSVKGEERVLVSRNIQSDPQSITALLESKNRSPAFRIILNPPSEDELNVVNGLSNDSISTAGVCVQEHVKRYLKSEEEAMEERIRRYTEEQKNQFAMVQSRAYNDKRAMLSILREAAESKVKECLSDAMADVLETDSEGIHEERSIHSTGYHLQDVTNIEILQASSNTKSPGKNDNNPNLECDNFDPIFKADEEFEPFVESDEEESSDNSFNQTDEYEKARNSTRTKYSSSVPVNVPLLRTVRRGKHEKFLDEEDNFAVPAPEKMAESIQALARSICDSSDIFGELPRPRINTFTATST